MKRHRLYEVYLESDEYGFESFRCYTVSETMECIKRLIKSARQCIEDDGIERRIGVTIRSEEE